VPERFDDTHLTAAIVVVDDALRAIARANQNLAVPDNRFTAPLREHLERERIRLLREAVQHGVYSAEVGRDFTPAPDGRPMSQIEAAWGAEVHAAVKGGKAK
jgi:hypothetical protein